MELGEIKVQGLGKRFWFRSLGGGFTDPEAGATADDNTDDDEEESPLGIFRQPMTELWALRDVSFHLKPGERVGIIGANGSGKSTLIRLLSRALPPSEGTIEGAGIVVPFGALSSPLSPDVSGCDNLRMLARLLDIPQDHLEERLPAIVDFAELGALAHEKVSRYSDRSFARLSSAMALFVDASIYLVDNDIKAGDEAYRIKFYTKFAEVLQRRVTLCFASNKLAMIRQYCSRAILFDHGRVVGDGEVERVIRRFLAISDQAIDLDEIEMASDIEGNAKPPDLGRSADASGHRQPEIVWAKQVESAESAWDSMLKRWREKSRGDGPAGIEASIVGASAWGTIRHLCCKNADGAAMGRCLPGETVIVELLIETFGDNVKVEVRLEILEPKAEWLTLVAEPLIPFTATTAGQYLFRVELPGTFMACCNARVALKVVMRVAFGKKDSGRQMVEAKRIIDLRGDVRFQLDEQRLFAGAPATSIIEPAPSFVMPPAEIEGSDRISPPRRLTRWEMLNRRAAIRPKLAWMIYRIVETETERREELLHEDA